MYQFWCRFCLAMGIPITGHEVQNCPVSFMDDRKSREEAVIAHKNMVCRLMYVEF